MTVADMSMRLARPPLSAAEAQRLRRRAYSYDDRHAESISQTLLLASIAYPPAVDCAPSSPPAISKSAARLLQTFPDMADEAPELCSFVCALDHAGLRWYGRIFVARSCLCFAGTGILLGASPSSQQLLAATQWQPSSTTLASYSGSESLGKPATGRPWRKTSFKISYCDITRVSKELTMGMWPNAMTVATTHRHYIFTNFLRRDRAHHCLTSAWNHCLARAKPERPLPLLPEPRKAQAWSQPATPKLSLQRPKPPPVHLDPADGHRARPDASLLLASDSNTCESESTVCDLSPARDLVFPPAQAIQTCRRPNEAQPPSPPAAWHAGGLGIARVASRHPYGYSHHTLFLLAMLAAFGLLLALGAAPAGHGR
ncbi:hypothetical protein H4R26_000776 [Coemansia thaxteri]|uniref:Uncharacterized protein n=1 Tax=Coemansia thaxteri TaxID=2663907 RepID=A0A9W8EL42_9FUNG|nr:hypothetical protein H4R26_000776 [Coemansia thaxteri]